MDFLAQSMRGSSRRTRRVFLPLLMLLAAVCLALVADSASRAQTEDSPPSQQPPQQRNALQASPEGQSQADVDRKNAGCVSCHTTTDQPTMHPTGTVRLACIDCHGGDSSVHVLPGAQMGSAQYEDAKNRAHPKSTIPEWARSSANPVRPYTEWLHENYDYIRFINPGDLRVAPQTCGQSGCHVSEVRRVQTSLMTTGSLLWGAALYNNGAYPLKDSHFGESYSADGTPQAVFTMLPPPTPEETRAEGASSRKSPRSNGGKFRSPATSCASSSAAAKRRARSAIRIARKNPATRTTS